jgi:hypothetical protein
MRVTLICILKALAQQDVDVAGRQLRMGTSFLQANDIAADNINNMNMDDIDLSRVGTGHETATEKRMEEIGEKVNLDDLEKRVKAMNDQAVKALQETSAAAPASSLLQTGEADQEAEHGKQETGEHTDKRAEAWLDDMKSISQAKSEAGTESGSQMDAKMKSWIAEFDRIKEDGMKTLDSLRPRPKISFNELEKKIHALEVLTGVDTKKQQSLLETAADAPKPTFASVGAKIEALEKKWGTSDAEAAPSSFIQLGEQYNPSSLVQLAAQVKSKEFAKSLLEAAENSDEVKRFNARTDAKFAALKERLHKLSQRSLESDSMVPMSFAQAGAASGRIPSWAETDKMLAEERSSLEAFSRRNEEQIEALKEHKPISSVLQMGMDANPEVDRLRAGMPSSFLEAPKEDVGEKTKKAVDEYMKDFNEGIREGALQAKKMPAFTDPAPSSLVEDPATDAANAGMKDLYQIDASMRKMQADQEKMAEDSRKWSAGATA